jgi:hypothetical protein
METRDDVLALPIFAGSCLLEIATRTRVRAASPTRGRFKARLVTVSGGLLLAMIRSLG